MDYKLINNKEAKQYQIQIVEPTARIEDILAGNKLFLSHNEVPER